MRPSKRSSITWRGLALLSGMLCVVGMSVPAAWSTAARDDRSSLGSGLYPVAYAITGAKIVTAPGKSIDSGTIVVRRGMIEAVGPTKDVAVPYDAETIDGKGLVVYPGFIDLYTTVGPAGRSGAVGDRQGPAGRPGRGAPVSTPPDNRRGLTPEFEVAAALESHRRPWPSPGGGSGLPTCSRPPPARSRPARARLVSLSGLPRREAIIAAPVALHVNLGATQSEPAAAGTPATPRRPDARPHSRPRPVPAPRHGSERARRKPLSPRPDGLDRPLSPGHARQPTISRSSTAYYEAHGGRRAAVRSRPSRRSQAARAKKLARLVGSQHPRRDPPRPRPRRRIRHDGRHRRRPRGRQGRRPAQGGQGSGRAPAELPRGAQGPHRAGVPQKGRGRARRAAARAGRPQGEVEGTGRRRRPRWPRPGFPSPSPPRASTASTRSRLCCASSSPRGSPPMMPWLGLPRTPPPSPASTAGSARLEPGKLGHLIAMTAPFSEERAKVKIRLDRRPEVRDQARRSRPHQGSGGRGGVRWQLAAGRRDRRPPTAPADAAGRAGGSSREDE